MNDNPLLNPIRIILLRHGLADGQKGVMSAPVDADLSETGVSQAEMWAKAISGFRIDVILSSDIKRCVTTASIISGHTETKPTTDKRLREIDLGEFQGLTWDDINKRWPDAMKKRMADPEGFRPPGGESIKDAAIRLQMLLDELTGFPLGSNILAISHSAAIKLIIALTIGIPFRNIFCIEQDTAAISVLDYFNDGTYVLKHLNFLPQTTEQARAVLSKLLPLKKTA